MELAIVTDIGSLDANEWNRLNGSGNPFLRHEFLAALERHACVGRRHGWLPHHLVARDVDGRLAAAVPLYLKDNSYGEFVFDWSWADAYQRAGLPYYPKSVVAVPYTPATGPRLLVREGAGEVADQLIELAIEWSRDSGLSSLHWLFTTTADTRRLQDHGLLTRLGCQFHWRNRGYGDFDDYLSLFTSRKRKKLRRERRQVADAGIELRTVHGNEASDGELETLFGFYRSTFDKKWGHATLTLDFFREIAATMGPQLVCFIASRNGEAVAGAICFRSDTALYGRHWGCSRDYHSLHFETCYYQGIDYCIRHGLELFEPGAQGEHKISRGFLPTPTWSAHWIADPGFRELIGRFLQQETDAMRDYIDDMNRHSPFREAARP